MEINEVYLFIARFLSANVRTAIPILLVALGMVYSERAGIVNIGGEGMMLIGSLFGVAGSFWFGSHWYGALVAIIAGALAGLLFGFIVITLKGDQIVTGIAFNLLALGLTTSFSRVIFSSRPRVSIFRAIRIPILSELPFVGPAIFYQSALVYISLLLVPLTSFILYKTTFGLKLRAVGEKPIAADTVGVNVYLIRYISIIIGGAFAGLGGAALSIDLVQTFTENMVSGRGFIAIAAVIFGKWKPKGTLIASILFSAGYAIVYRVQAVGLNIPHQFLLMIPYILTIAALAGFVGECIPPAASSKSYDKEG